MIECIKTNIVNAPDVPISNAVLASGTIYTVQVPRDPQTHQPSGQGDIEVQATRVFQQLAHVLECAGSDLNNVAQMTIYLVNKDDAKKMNEVYKTFFNIAPYPNRATVVVKELMGSNCLIEIVVHAVKK
ncbi:RidA family protein [Paralcaligenes sp. KSB-10]|uniref:RidA family protein n=1 Tax=Paralcaligenes sp. KSB-10 TaxID=2901142 RepID=UPI001E2BBC97|nr:RidA family protein [Paralcaligenes sp. KSB-10]UHL62995.1 RidA family protein [Paralcaligenes sp. KSB-10]